nr:uncharacterized protein LOC127318115 [Lolium perenne]
MIQQNMRIPLTLLLPLALLLVLAVTPGEASFRSCTSQIISPFGTSCNRAACQFQCRIGFTQIPCDNGATDCTWTGECVGAGCNFTFCATFPQTPAPVLIPELDQSTGN